MKRYIAVFILLSGLGALGALSSVAAAPPDSAFARMQSLAGMWEGLNPLGKPVRVTYEVTSNDSVVLEKMVEEDGPTMITIYHNDGDDLRMTHFCAAQNQPRMIAVKPDADAATLSFQFVDATNISETSPGHMHGLQITFKDVDHITLRWTWKENEQTTDSVFELSRVR